MAPQGLYSKEIKLSKPWGVGGGRGIIIPYNNSRNVLACTPAVREEKHYLIREERELCRYSYRGHNGRTVLFEENTEGVEII